MTKVGKRDDGMTLRCPARYSGRMELNIAILTVQQVKGENLTLPAVQYNTNQSLQYK